MDCIEVATQDKGLWMSPSGKEGTVKGINIKYDVRLKQLFLYFLYIYFILERERE